MEYGYFLGTEASDIFSSAPLGCVVDDACDVHCLILLVWLVFMKRPSPTSGFFQSGAGAKEVNLCLLRVSSGVNRSFASLVNVKLKQIYKALP